ncbi:MAG: hypothetical protein JJU36_04015 [Phycisphaeraceae bacterium]|nr:hypothetical protein [Phycisphaeraceae bacterium]
MGIGIDLAYGAAAVGLAPVLLVKRHRRGRLRTDWRARFGHGEALPDSDRPTLLIHAVSVGEAHAVEPLIDLLLRPRAVPVPDGDAAKVEPACRVVLSVSTDTGFERATRLYQGRAQVVRFPYDFSWMVRRFLDRIRPDMVALAELEVWPNFTQICRARGIAIGVINGRLTERSFRGYRRFLPLVRPMFGRLDFVGAQTRAIAARFGALGVADARITVTDSVKWDQAAVRDDCPGSREMAEAMGIDAGRPLVVAGSTAPGEEEMLIKGCPPGVQLLLAPRRSERFAEVAQMMPDVVRRSACADGTSRSVDGRRFFLLDTMGELTKAYALADAVVVGRSFLGLYGSNVLEPVALGKPTLIGPHYGDFQEIVDALVDREAIVVTPDPWPAIQRLLADRSMAAAMAERGRAVILEHQGVAQRTLELLWRHGLERSGPSSHVG